MKAYTNLEQSKILAEILPIESADMTYCPSAEDDEGNTLYTADFKTEFIHNGEGLIPCWSLVALLKELPDTMLGKDKDGYVVMVETMGSGLTTFAPNPVDACYEMILELHELKLL